MAQVFISYSREDKAFVSRLRAALVAANRDVWVDLSDIPPSAKWLEEAFVGIDAADAFVLVLSPAAVASDPVRQELDHALAAKKRIIPIVYQDVDHRAVNPEVAVLNWIFFRPSDDFDAAFAQLTFALDTDLAYWHQASQLLTRARQWEARKDDSSLALRGSELEDAERWLTEGASKTPSPTPLQTRFITTSRRVATTRQRRLLGGVSVALVVVLILSVFSTALLQVTRADNDQLTAQATTLRAQVLAGEAQGALLEGHVDQALLLAVEASRHNDSYITRGALFNALEYSPHLAQTLQSTLVPAPQVASPSGTLPSAPLAAAFDASGQQVSAVNQDGAVTTWDTASHKTLRQFSVWNASAVQSCGMFYTQHASLSADGHLLFFQACDEVDVWDVMTGSESRSFPIATSGGSAGVPAAVVAMSLSPDGARVASLACAVIETAYVNACDWKVDLWDAQSGTRLADFDLGALGNVDPSLLGVTFSADGRFLALLVPQLNGGNAQFGILNTTTLTMRGLTTTSDLAGSALCRGARNDILAIAGAEPNNPQHGKIAFFDLTSGAAIGTPIILSGAEASSCAFSPDGEYVVTSGPPSTTGSNALYLWQTATGALVGQPLVGHSGQATVFGFSPDGQHFIAGDSSGNLLVWRVAPHSDYSLLPSSPFGASLQASAASLWSLDTYSPESDMLVAVSPSGTREWSLLTGKSTGEQPYAGSLAAGDAPSAVATSADGHLIAVGTKLGDIVLLDAGTQTVIATLHENDATAYRNYLQSVGVPSTEELPLISLLLSPDSHYLLAQYAGMDTVLWNLQTRQYVTFFPAPTVAGPGSGSNASIGGFPAAFSPDGRYLAVGTGDPQHEPSQFVELWALSAGKLAQTWKGALPATGLTSLAFSPDGKTLAVGGADGSVRLWSATAGTLVVTLSAGSVGASYTNANLAFTPDGTLLVQSYNQTITLWDVRARGLYVAPMVEPSSVLATYVSGDGKLLVAFEANGSVVVRYLKEADWQAGACGIAGRNLTKAEWAQFFGGEPYHKTCPQFSGP